MMEIEKNFFDVVVVGAGPAGVSAATTIARGGRKVLLLERGVSAGSKNMIGGAVFLSALKEIFPDSYKNAPIERYINKHTWSLLDKKSSVDVTYDNQVSQTSASIYRSKFDSWLVEEAKKAGVYFSPQTLVLSAIVENDRVVGVKTELEEIYAPITILADGVNSLLAKQLGLKDEHESKDIVLAVKETIKLSKEIIDTRFNVDFAQKQGAMRNFIGGLSDDNQEAPFALGFMYTYQDAVSIGLGVNLKDLEDLSLNPSELLDKLKEHPVVKPLIQGGELLEYSAHLIPEGGYNKLPKLSDAGVMVVGDAAGFVNGVHFEGTNFAMISGKLAGETALWAISANEFDKNAMQVYEKKLKNSFVMKDLKSYKNVIESLYSRTNSIMKYYPKKACEFFEIFTGALGVPKRESFRGLICDFFKQRSLAEFFADLKAFIVAVFGVLK